jgi:pimeloyl-ACP methyl ester carboxylesterase
VPSVGEDILALLAHLDGAAAHVVATSFAPAPAIWAATERPEGIRSLVLISPFVRTARLNPLTRLLFWLMMNNPWRVRTWVKYYGTLYPTCKPDDFEDYLRVLRANLSEPGRFDAVKRLGASSRQPSAERLSQVQTPTLVIMGTKDPDFPNPAEEGEEVAKEVGGELVLVEGAGHYPQTEMPEKTTPIVREFLGRFAA